MKESRKNWGRRAVYLCAAFSIFVADQVSKAWAIQTLKFGDDRTIIKGLLDLVYAENPGIAFGQLQDGGNLGRWLFVSLAVAALIAVAIYFVRSAAANSRVLGACALLLAGISGNLVDRIRFGFVIDFILAHAGEYHWPVFNLADSAICVGAFLLALDVLFGSKRRDVPTSAEPTVEA